MYCVYIWCYNILHFCNSLQVVDFKKTSLYEVSFSEKLSSKQEIFSELLGFFKSITEHLEHSNVTF